MAKDSKQEKPEVTAEQARAVLVEQQQQNMREGMEEVNAILQKRGLRLDIVPPQITIVPTK